MSKNIRLATEADSQQAASAYRASRRGAFANLIPEDAVLPRTEAEDVQRWCDFVTAADGLMFVAVEEGTVVGIAALELGDVAELGALYVDPEWQGKGIGSSLLRRTLSAAPGSHSSVITWVLAANQEAKSFFLRHGGWLDGGVEIRSVGSARLVMQRIRFELPSAQVTNGGPDGRA